MFVKSRFRARKHLWITLYGIQGVRLKIDYILQPKLSNIFLVSPHKCGVCGKTYTRRTILLQHEKKHFPQPKVSKPEAVKVIYPCSYCDKTFTKNAYLKEHIAHKHTQGNDKIIECNRNHKSSDEKKWIRRISTQMWALQQTIHPEGTSGGSYSFTYWRFALITENVYFFYLLQYPAFSLRS